MAKKKSTVAKVTEAVTDAVAAVGQAAKKNVVKPVGKALGLTGSKKKPAAKKATTAKATTAKATAAKKPTAKKPAAKKK